MPPFTTSPPLRRLGRIHHAVDRQIVSGPHAARRSMSSIRASTPGRPRTALFFPGQGVQRVGMTQPWLDAFPGTVRPLLDEIDDVLQTSLTRIIAEGPNSLLTATDNAQPAIMATSIVILRVLERDFGFRTQDTIDVTLGHSLGEFAALVAGGYLSYRDALVLTRKRAEVMTRCSASAAARFGGEVGMVALITEPEQRDAMVDSIHEYLAAHPAPAAVSDDGPQSDDLAAQVLIANVNSKNQIVLSGSIRGITALLEHLRRFSGHDPRAVRLKADSPFHSPIMRPAAELMTRMLSPSTASSGSSSSATTTSADPVRFPGLFPVISNVSARPFASAAQLKDLLARQCIETVQWHASIQYLHQEARVTRWLGVGPGKVGRNLVGKEVGMQGSVKGGGVWAVSEPGEVEGVLRGLEETERIDVDGER